MFTAALLALLPWLLRLQALGVCAACRQALETSGQAGLVRGLAWSVVVMLSAPIMMVTFFIITVVRSTRRHQAALAAANQAAKVNAGAPPVAATESRVPPAVTLATAATPATEA